MNVELNASVVIDDWQAVVNRTVANYFDSLGFEHLDQVLDMRVFDLLNMNLSMQYESRKLSFACIAV